MRSASLEHRFHVVSTVKKNDGDFLAQLLAALHSRGFRDAEARICSSSNNIFGLVA